VLKIMEKDDLDYYFVFASSNGEERKKFVEFVEENCPRKLNEGRIKVGLDISKFLTNNKKYNKFIEESFLKYFGKIKKSKVFTEFFKHPFQQFIDVYLHPALDEALSLSVIEAQMCGTPVIASWIGGIPEIVSPEFNKLIPLPQDVYSRGEMREYAVKLTAKCILNAIKSFRKKGIDYNTKLKIRKNVIKKGLTVNKMSSEILKLIKTLSENFKIV